MPRIKLTLQYKGTNYLGWQVQPQGPTVQSVLEEKLSAIFKKKIITNVSGRTDAGVHALFQVAHFDVEPFSMKPINLLMGLNSSLPADISVLKVQIVPSSFHAQRSVKKKVYQYTIFNSSIPSPFLTEYSWRVPYPLNIPAMRRAAKVLVGRHDFKSFCASDSNVKTTVRRVDNILIRTGEPCVRPYSTGGAIITLTFTGPGFLKHMVRNMVGTLVDVGRGKLTEKDIQKILKSRDRKKAGMTAPAYGLVLKKVMY
ncbi:MAG: tRNA pseudouridine(38-40) synthase TruA [Deltaproteobacteria bacterium GWA2_45_12]|nr:MAG: tRNA pseudouridine(38-40) synthase TruA [Deltaproteobacteria bacterium GWA2_45_12]